MENFIKLHIENNQEILIDIFDFISVEDFKSNDCNSIVYYSEKKDGRLEYFQKLVKETQEEILNKYKEALMNNKNSDKEVVNTANFLFPEDSEISKQEHQAFIEGAEWMKEKIARKALNFIKENFIWNSEIVEKYEKQVLNF